jgi:Protein of unknown function (DUF2490)
MSRFSATPQHSPQDKAARETKSRVTRFFLSTLLCAALMFCFDFEARAQYEDSGLWLGGFATGKLPPPLNNAKGSWRLWTDGQLRFGDDFGRFSQGLVRPGVGYALNDAWSVWAGYTYVRTDQPYARTPTNEQRIWEQVSWQRKAGGTDLSSRTRLEQRFSSAGSGTGWRLREMGKLMHPLGQSSIWLIAMYDEIFINLNSPNFGPKSGVDRNRAFLGPGINLGKPLRLELGYLNQYTFNNNGPDRVDHILSISAFWNFSRKGSPPEE